MEEKVVINKEMLKSAFEPKEVEWNGIKFLVRPTVDFAEAISMILLATEKSFSTEDDELMPELLEMMLDMLLVEFYTNIELDVDDSEKYEIFNLPELIDTIKENISLRQFNNIEYCIREKCKAKVRRQEAEHSKEIKELFDNLTKGMNGLEDIFKDVSPDDLAALTEIFGSGEINEENIVKAIMGVNKTEGVR